MEKLKQYLKNTSFNEHLGIWGGYGEYLFSLKDGLEKCDFFHEKKITILVNPVWPKKTNYFVLSEKHREKFNDEIYLFAIFLTEKNCIMVACSDDSFVF